MNDVSPIMKRGIAIVWLLLVPAGMWYTYQSYPPPSSVQWLDILAFLLLTSIVASMPIVINEMFIFLIQWVTLVVFLKFGLFFEMVFAQISVVVLLVRLRVLRKGEWFRLPLNLIMFFLVSFVSGSFYYLIGGQLAPSLSTNPSALLLAAFYAVLNYLLNQVIVSFNLYFIYKSKEPIFSKDLFVETVTTIVTFPIGFVLYILYHQVGLLAILFVGIPFVSLSIIFNLYYSSQKMNEYLQKAAEIGHQMAERLNMDDVVNVFIQRLSEMLPVDYAYILDVQGDDLVVDRMVEQGQVVAAQIPPLKKNEGISGMVWAENKAYLYSSRKEWRKFAKSYIPDDAESLLCVPIVRSKKIIGVLVLASKRKRAYEKYQLNMVDILCSYFAVAIENAKHYERTKIQSERCPLTKLYNFRYFEGLLTREFEKLTRFERKSLSLIILDIDHFKSINDTYGHQSGNEILIDIAGRINKLVANRGTVARYGGEEFVVLLPDVVKQDAYQVAEHIRESIANWPFTLMQALDQDNKKIQVKITVSIGVATAPEDAEDALALVRHADRALYVGAKRAGRNRVAEYSSN
ncbi:sensor domain-containing diguanylate cyclase [Neobacillus dielmonensis]|uniref:sensor domain-containing diguanylate cyclase n=1 Tax=Neobacillus dielmonensis TaxID=1347369 RepID=UPI0009E06253|nr:sensor domain-containing diguanylate cyclase [Neobacillus dielmonensis]